MKNDNNTSNIEKLQKAVREADALAQQKSNFLATMSHEIRTPMQTIFGLLELIVEEKPEHKISSMALTAQGAASGLLEILDDILDIAKMDADAMELDMFEVPVRLLVRGILEALSVKVHGSNVELMDEITTDVPFVIIGDPKRLRQILINLCGNALKFTNEGHVTVRVTTYTKSINIPDGGIGLRFEIADTGIGMSEETCAKLFQSFTQADNTTSRQYGGTGLGLSISKKLVNIMGGEIGVTSIVGEGSIFWFEIPTEEVRADQNTVDLPDLDGISVLSVEDHPQGAKEIVSSLRSMGAKVESCATYAEGLELACRRPFDVAIIDQGLPDGLGIDLIRKIIPMRPAMGIVMYTVRDDIGLAHSLQALGATYLTKPAGRAGLGEAVKRVAQRHIGVIDGPTRLLIAEDTASVRDILRRQLEKLNIDADFVNDGREALEALKTEKYGILLTDLHMPNIDGYDLVKTIREREEGTDKHFPIIALTADVQLSHRDTYLYHGFDECLLKPVSMGQFKRLLIRWNLLDEKLNDVVPKITKKNGNIPPAIDLNHLIANMGAIDEDAIEMMEMFVEMTAPIIKNIENALEAKDDHAISENGHSLKGSARSAGCMILGDLAAKLQDDAAIKKDCSNLIVELDKEFKRVKIEVKDLKPQ